jgi:hypothetical protein
MGDVVNLERARKKREYAARKRRAAHVWLRKGRTKAEREKAQWEAEQRRRELDGKRLGATLSPPEPSGRP